MAKALIVAALCILGLATFAHAHDTLFNVEGKVYCDTCRVQFETRISENLPGATVRLECRDRDTARLTYSVDGLTNDKGLYSLPVEGDHQTDICEVRVVKSPKENCCEPMEERARVLCTDNSGLINEVRYANPIGFMLKESLSECKEVLDELGFFPLL